MKLVQLLVSAFSEQNLDFSKVLHKEVNTLSEEELEGIEEALITASIKFQPDKYKEKDDYLNMDFQEFN